MRKILKYSLWICAVGIVFFLGRQSIKTARHYLRHSTLWNQKSAAPDLLTSSSPTAQKKKRSSSKKSGSEFDLKKANPTSEFVFVIPSYNNSRWCEKNLRSVFDQTYANYRIIYIDDASTDDTHQKVKDLTAKYGKQGKMTLIHNDKNCGAVENIYRAVQSCKDKEIAILLDGDDWLSDDWVLDKLSQIYANSEVWLTYGSYVSYPGFIKGECSQPIPHDVRKSNSIRQYVKKEWILSHLRSFYAGLFKQIKFQDVLHHGRFFESTYDQVFMLPLVEMAAKHVRYVDDVMLIYNRATPLNDDKVNLAKQNACRDYVHKMPCYQPLKEFPETVKILNLKTDLAFVSSQNDQELIIQLQHIKNCLHNINRVFVFDYFGIDKEIVNGIQNVYQNVTIIDSKGVNFKSLVITYLNDYASPYLLFADVNYKITSPFNLKECIEAYEKAGAFTFYLDQPAAPLHVRLDNEIQAFQYEASELDPIHFGVNLFKKEKLYSFLKNKNCASFDDFKEVLSKDLPPREVGLFYQRSKDFVSFSEK